MKKKKTRKLLQLKAAVLLSIQNMLRGRFRPAIEAFTAEGGKRASLIDCRRLDVGEKIWNQRIFNRLRGWEKRQMSSLYFVCLLIDFRFINKRGLWLPTFFFFFLRSKFTPAEFIRMMDRPAKEKKERGVHLPIRHRLLYMFSTVQPILWLAAIRHIRVCCYYTTVGQLFFLRREYE